MTGIGSDIVPRQLPLSRSVVDSDDELEYPPIRHACDAVPETRVQVELTELGIDDSKKRLAQLADGPGIAQRAEFVVALDAQLRTGIGLVGNLGIDLE